MIFNDFARPGRPYEPSLTPGPVPEPVFAFLNAWRGPGRQARPDLGQAGVSAAAPSTMPLINTINSKILAGEMYKALKETKRLIDYQSELLAT